MADLFKQTRPQNLEMLLFAKHTILQSLLSVTIKHHNNFMGYSKSLANDLPLSKESEVDRWLKEIDIVHAVFYLKPVES